MEEASFSMTLKNSTGYDSGMLTIRGDKWEDFVVNLEAARKIAEEDALIRSFFDRSPFSAQDEGASADSSSGGATPAKPKDGTSTGVRGLNEPCAECSKPKTRVIRPREGQTWTAFAACDNRDHRG